MAEKAKALGIPEKDLTRALTLIRDLRATALRENLDPRATRIALIFANLVDSHFARGRLSAEDENKLLAIAWDLYLKGMVNTKLW